MKTAAVGLSRTPEERYIAMRLFHRQKEPAGPRRERRRALRPRFSILQALLIAALIAAVLMLAGIIPNPFSTGGRKAGTTVTEFGLKDIGELATQDGIFTVVQNVTLSRKLLVTIPGSEETYVFSYDGHVKAGLDFADITVDVDDTAKKIRVTLPEIRILSVELNEDTFRQYSGGQNLLSQMTPEEVAQSRAKAKEKARETAIANGILDNARENAKVLVSGHLAGYFDLDVYEIEYAEPETAGEEEQ